MMRSFLYFTTLCSLISLVNANCYEYKCPRGNVILGDGTKFIKEGEQGLETAKNSIGCLIGIDRNCNIATESLVRIGQFAEHMYGKCLVINGVYVCVQKKDTDYQYPLYSVEAFDQLIETTGFIQCKYLRFKFAQWEKEREECLTVSSVSIIVSCSIIGFILLCIAACVGGGLGCYFSSKKKKNAAGAPPVAPVVAPIGAPVMAPVAAPVMAPVGPPVMAPGVAPGMMDPGMCGPPMAAAPPPMM